MNQDDSIYMWLAISTFIMLAVAIMAAFKSIADYTDPAHVISTPFG